MSLTKASYSMISGAPINVVDYGFATTASAATNKAALLAAITAGGEGSLIVIPNGTFQIDGEIQLTTKGVTIQGAASNYRYQIDGGFTGTELKFMSGTTGFDLTKRDDVYATSSEYSVLRNLNINGNSVLQNAVYVQGCKIIQNCTIQNAVNGIRLGGWINQTIIEKCGIVANSTGVLVDGIANTIFKVADCNIRTNTIGVKIVDDSGGNFEQCVIESNTSYGLLISVLAGGSVGNIKFYNCWFENNGYGIPIQQIRIEGVDAIPDISFITFDYCTFDTGSNTTRQDCYLDGGNYTRFTRCKFTNYAGISTGIVLTTKCSSNSFFNCQRGVQVGLPLEHISDSGYATYIQPSPQTYVGPNLVAASTWTNGGYTGYTSTGNKITAAISTGGAATATLSTITRSKGVSYAMQIYVNVSSGQAPTFTLTNGNNTTALFTGSVNGIKIFYYTENLTGSAGVLTASNSAACSWQLYVNLIEYEVARGYIDFTAG